MQESVIFARLAIAALVWFLLHAAVAGAPLRDALVQRFGDKAYRGGFSFGSLASLWWLIYEYGRAPYVRFWTTPRPLYILPLVLVPVAFVLLAGPFSVPSPTALGGEKLLETRHPGPGLLRVTRHP